MPAGGGDRREDCRQWLVPGKRSERFESVELLPFGELFGADLGQELVDVGSPALGREAEGESSPLAVLEFFTGLTRVNLSA